MSATAALATERNKLVDRIAQRERSGRLSATPERMNHTEEPFTIVGEDKAQRVDSSPLERLYRTGGLAGPERDEDKATERYNAGMRLYDAWYYGRLNPLGSRDYRKPFTGPSDHFAIMPAVPRQILARQRYRQAQEALGSDRIASVTHAIVIDEKPVADVGIIVTGRNDKAQARAVATEFLIEGLDRLVRMERGR